MGFRHIFLLDNGSSDQTIPIAKQHKSVSIYQSTFSIEANQGIYKRYLARHLAGGGWCLDVDIDEFFDYPYSNILSLNEFIEYLNRNGFTAVVTQMLDMFSDRPIFELAKNWEEEEDLRTVYPYFDISEITRTRYRESEVALRYGNRNTLSNEGTELHEGGIRKTLCGINLLLTKHSLFLPAKKLELFPHVHFQNNARLADLSCVLLHYKLTRNALASALQNKERMPGIGNIYEAIIKYVTDESANQIKQHATMKFRSTSDLVDCGFLFASEDYQKYVKSKSVAERVLSSTQ